MPSVEFSEPIAQLPNHFTCKADGLELCKATVDHKLRGSIKANIGHLEAASGLAGILKCILILERGIIPPNALFERLNPRINAKANKIAVKKFIF